MVRFPSSGRLTPRGLGSLARLVAAAATTPGASGGSDERGRADDLFLVRFAGSDFRPDTLVVFYGSEVLRFLRAVPSGGGWRGGTTRGRGDSRPARGTRRRWRGKAGCCRPGAEVIVAACALPAAFANQLDPVGRDGVGGRSVAGAHGRAAASAQGAAGSRAGAGVAAGDFARADRLSDWSGWGDGVVPGGDRRRACRAGGVRASSSADWTTGLWRGVRALHAVRPGEPDPGAQRGGDSAFRSWKPRSTGKPAAAFPSGGVAEAVRRRADRAAGARRTTWPDWRAAIGGCWKTRRCASRWARPGGNTSGACAGRTRRGVVRGRREA